MDSSHETQQNRSLSIRQSTTWNFRLQKEAYNIYVEGHDKPFTRTELLKFLNQYHEGE